MLNFGRISLCLWLQKHFFLANIYKTNKFNTSNTRATQETKRHKQQWKFQSLGKLTNNY